MDTFSTSDPTLERRFKGHRGEITGLSFSSDNKKLVSSSSDSLLFLWSFKQNTRAIKFEKHEDSVNGVQFSPDDKFIASCSKDKSVRLWKPSVKTTCKSFKAHTSSVRSIHISPDSSTLLTASNDKNIKTSMSKYQNKFLSTFRGHTNWVNCARFSPNGQMVVSCSEDKTVKLWDPLSNVCTHTFEEKGVPKYVEFHPNGKCIGVGFSSNMIKIYDTRKYNLLQFYPIHLGSVNQISFHPSGKFLISGSSDSTVKVCDLIEGRLIYTLEGHEGPVTAVVFSPDGTAFASGGADKTVLVWKTNFDQEALAKPLGTNMKKGTDEKNALETNINNEAEGNKARTVDVRHSFSEVEEPEIENSFIENEDSDVLQSEKNVTRNSEESNITPQAVNSDGENTVGRDGQELSPNHFHNEDNNNINNSFTDDLKQCKNVIKTLTLAVKNIENQLTSVMDVLERLERNSVCNETDRPLCTCPR